MGSFNFFSSYYEAIKILPDGKREKLYDSIMAFMFDDVVPVFGDDEDIEKAMYTLMKPTLEKSKIRSNNKRGKIKTESNQNQNEEQEEKQTKIKSKSKRNQNEIKTESNSNQTPPKEKEKEKDKDKGLGEGLGKGVDLNTPPYPPTGEKPLTAKAMIEERNLSPQLETATKEWVQYKDEKRQKYKPTGLKNLLTEIQNNVNAYGDQAVVEVMQKSMAAGYTGIVWDWLKKKQPVARSGTTGFDATGYLLSQIQEGDP